MKSGYTFMSISTPKPGRLDDLIAIAQKPPAAMGPALGDALLAYQVSVDCERETVVVWSTFRDKAALYDYLASDTAKGQHGEDDNMEEIIESFHMYDMTPVSGTI